MCKCNKKTLCQPKSCGCPIPDLSAACVVYKNNDLTCTGIPGDDTLENIIKGLDTAICEKFELFTGYGALINIGAGAEIYKGNDVQGRKELRTLISSNESVTITEDEDTIDLSVDLSGIGDGIPRFIVNNLYQGDDEQGTLNKPYKTIQAAINAFVGNGNRNYPEFQNGIIVIQKGNTYVFTGDFSYRNVNIILEEGVNLFHSPSVGKWFMDLDSLDSSGVDNTVTLRSNAKITLQQQGFRNKGKLTSDPSSNSKSITLEGSGETSQIRQNKLYDEEYTILDINSENDDNYSQSPGSPMVISNLFLRSTYCSILRTGGNDTIYFSGSRLDAGASSAVNADSMRKPFYQNDGGNIDIQNCVIIAIGTGVKMSSIFYTKQDDRQKTPKLNVERCVLQCQNNESIFMNSSTTKTSQPEVKCSYTTVRFGVADQVFSYPLAGAGSIWYNLNINYNVFNSQAGDSADLTNQNSRGVSNSFAGNVVENLPNFESRVAAASSLPVNTKFINRNSSTDEANWTIDIIL